jgi:hypothetical protein
MPDAELDAEAELRAAIGRLPVPRPDMAALVALLQTAQRQCAEVDAHTLAAARSNSLDATLDHAGHAVIAAEGAAHALLALGRMVGTLRSEATAAEVGTRHALGAAMHGTGTLLFPLEHHNVELAQGAEHVEIHKPAELPAAYWRDKEPEPDKLEIGRALRLGKVPGARFARGPRSVRITQRKGTP